MFEIISVKPRNSFCNVTEEILHTYYYNGDILIKTKQGKWYITDEGTFPPIIWKEITNMDLLWNQPNTIEELVIQWKTENISDKVKIKGAIEVWYMV